MAGSSDHVSIGCTSTGTSMPMAVSAAASVRPLLDWHFHACCHQCGGIQAYVFQDRFARSSALSVLLRSIITRHRKHDDRHILACARWLCCGRQRNGTQCPRYPPWGTKPVLAITLPWSFTLCRGQSSSPLGCQRMSTFVCPQASCSRVGVRKRCITFLWSSPRARC